MFGLTGPKGHAVEVAAFSAYDAVLQEKQAPLLADGPTTVDLWVQQHMICFKAHPYFGQTLKFDVSVKYPLRHCN